MSNFKKPKTTSRTLKNYLEHGSRHPIHVVRHDEKQQYVHSSSVAIHLSPITDKYSHNRRTAILDGMTVRAQRLNAFSRQLNQFTTTRKRINTFVSNINGKTKTTGGRFVASTTKRESMPKLASTLPKRGHVMS